MIVYTQKRADGWAVMLGLATTSITDKVLPTRRKAQEYARYLRELHA